MAAPRLLSNSRRLLSLLLPRRPLSSFSDPEPNPNPDPDPDPDPTRSLLRSRTPSEKQFDSWVTRLRPGFTSGDLESAMNAQTDPDLALDLFRWAALRPGYRHPPSSYLAALHVALSSRRLSAAEDLAVEALSGACRPPPDTPLYNTIIRFFTSRRHLFSKAFDAFNVMRNSSCKPTQETYSVLLHALVRRLGRPPACLIYLQSLKSLHRQMKAAGVVPDLFMHNLIIKAYSKCLEMDDTVRVFKELGLYGCEPNEYSYGYVAKGLCEKGRVREGFGYFKEMRNKGFVPTSSVYMSVVCSLVLERRFDEGVDVVFDMLECGRKPDLLTYRTLLEGLCREGRADDAFGLLEELGSRPAAMDRKIYSDLLDGLHWLCQPHAQE